MLIENREESMFYRKIAKTINAYVKYKQTKILCVDGARPARKKY